MKNILFLNVFALIYRNKNQFHLFSKEIVSGFSFFGLCLSCKKEEKEEEVGRDRPLEGKLQLQHHHQLQQHQPPKFISTPATWVDDWTPQIYKLIKFF